jgi:hypothetical protein
MQNTPSKAALTKALTPLIDTLWPLLDSTNKPLQKLHINIRADYPPVPGVDASTQTDDTEFEMNEPVNEIKKLEAGSTCPPTTPFEYGDYDSEFDAAAFSDRIQMLLDKLNKLSEEME